MDNLQISELGNLLGAAELAPWEAALLPLSQAEMEELMEAETQWEAKAA